MRPPVRRHVLAVAIVAASLVGPSVAVAAPAAPAVPAATSAGDRELGPERSGPGDVRVRTRDVVSPDACDPVLPAPRSGARALRDLGDRLPEVAAQNRRTAAELRDLLREDATLHVDRCGALFYVDPPRGAADGHDGHAHALEGQVHALEGQASATAEAGPTVAAADLPAPLAQTFTLNSRPGSERTIYLDFDGHVVTGTGWNQDRAASITLAPFTHDGDPAFSNTELAVIQRTWQRVAEDFAPFDVNVTTEDPGQAAIERTSSADQRFGTRAVITGTPPEVPGFCNGCAGLAYFDVFARYGTGGGSHGYTQPALVFTSSMFLDNGAEVFPPDPQQIADTISHEVGHNLALAHHGDAFFGEYSYGQGLWAPLMGGSFYPLSTWSDGGYAGATNTAQDDVARIAAAGAPPVVDDHGDDAAGATVLGAEPVEGVIHTRSDEDWFRFVAEGETTIAASSWAEGANLDVELQLVGGDGTTVLATDDPASSWPYFGMPYYWEPDLPATGMEATIARELAPGTYHARIRGVGSGDPMVDGYSDYGSLGRYVLTLETGAVTPPPPVAPVVTITAGPNSLVNSRTANFTFTSNTPGSAFECRLGTDGSWEPCTSPRSVTVTSDGPHTFAVRGRVGEAVGSPAGRSWTVDSVAPVITITGTPAQGASVTSTSADLDWSANEPLAGPFSCRLTVAGSSGAWQNDCGIGVFLSGLPTGSHRIEVRATDLAGNFGTASRSWTVTGATPPAPPPTGPAPTFSDVVPGSTHARAIGVLAQRGVTLGCGGTRFCPDQSVTRDQMATFLGRALELQPGSTSPPFLDVSAGSTHARYIDAVRRENITLGCGDGKRYCPRDVVARDQMASFLQRALEYEPGSSSPPFRDVRAGSTHARAIDALRREEVTTGCSTPGNYCPGASVTRAQMATFLVRALGW